MKILSHIHHIPKLKENLISLATLNTLDAREFTCSVKRGMMRVEEKRSYMVMLKNKIDIIFHYARQHISGEG